MALIELGVKYQIEGFLTIPYTHVPFREIFGVASFITTIQ